MFHTRFQNTSPYDLTSRRFDTKKRPKRRGVSPKLYPRKLLITEEKVAADLCNLCLNDTWQSNHHQTKLIGRRYRTVSEIEESLELSSDEENETGALKITISKEFQQDIKSFKEDMLFSSAQKLQLPATVKPDYSTALVLWKPPGGVINEIMRSLPPRPVEKTKASDIEEIPENGMFDETVTVTQPLKDYSMLLSDTNLNDFTNQTDYCKLLTQYGNSDTCFTEEFDDCMEL